MPITPHFEISQTNSHVHIEIKVPHVRVSPDSVQVVLTEDNRCLHFASPPYLLVLTFQRAFQENAEDFCAQYDVKEHGVILLKLAKEKEGEHWDDLDLVGALMKPRTNLKSFMQSTSTASPQKSKWLQEVLEESAVDEEPQFQGQCEEDEQNLSKEEIHTEKGYGFHCMFRGIFKDLARDELAREMLEVPLDTDSIIFRIDNPLCIAGDDENSFGNDGWEKQKQKRREMEASKFSSERYLQDLDLEDDYLYQNAMAMEPHWNLDRANDLPNIGNLTLIEAQKDSANMNTTTRTKANDFFSPEETAQMASIPYPLLPNTCGHDQAHHLWLGMLDILFGYVYDHLLTDGDPTVESAWTISILSCSLSWLESFDCGESTHDIVLQSIRRCMIYPYIRNFDFAIYIWKQVSQLLASGRRSVIRSLLQIRTILDKSELFYLGNKLFLDPYLAWLQKSFDMATDHSLEEQCLKYSKEIERVLSNCEALKEQISLDLPRIEKHLFQYLEEEEEEESPSSSEVSEDSDSSGEESKNDDDDNCSDKYPQSVEHLDDTTRTESKKPASSNHSIQFLEIGKEEKVNNPLLVEISSLSLNDPQKSDECAPQVVSRDLIEEIE